LVAAIGRQQRRAMAAAERQARRAGRVQPLPSVLPRIEQQQARNAAIIPRLADGASMQTVAKEFGITRQRVSKIAFRVTGQYTRPPTSRRFAWTPERVAALRSLWGDGLRPAAIGQRWGVSGSVIAAKARHLRLPPHQATWTDDRVAMLRRLQSQGLHGAEIAQRLGVSLDAVLSKMRRLKLPLRKITWTDNRIAMLRLLQDQGLQAAEIAQRLGLSRSRVYGATHRLGLSFRARRAEIKAGLVAQAKTPKPVDTTP
jgi:hypothetical protein